MQRYGDYWRITNILVFSSPVCCDNQPDLRQTTKISLISVAKKLFSGLRYYHYEKSCIFAHDNTEALCVRANNKLNMKRKLFCEISPFTYRLSMEKEILKRHLKDFFRNTLFAKERTENILPVLVYRHNSLIRRRLGNVNMQLQENKATNLALAVTHITGLIIRPSETFSVWKQIGRTSKRKGYKEGLTIAKGQPSQGIGGGLCQLSNLIHWMVLHSELTIVEHHHHDGVDLFPDYGRKIPFGTGTSISYNYIDYRVKNDTNRTYQLRLWVDDEYLCGELRATEPQPYTFHIHAENEFFSRENGIVYRNGQVYRDIIDRTTGQCIDSQLIRTNHARVMYDYPPCET